MYAISIKPDWAMPEVSLDGLQEAWNKDGHTSVIEVESVGFSDTWLDKDTVLHSVNGDQTFFNP